LVSVQRNNHPRPLNTTNRGKPLAPPNSSSKHRRSKDQSKMDHTSSNHIY
jgi:hypothetical protein